MGPLVARRSLLRTELDQLARALQGLRYGVTSRIFQTKESCVRLRKSNRANFHCFS